jgi:hypothetical protein
MAVKEKQLFVPEARQTEEAQNGNELERLTIER